MGTWRSTDTGVPPPPFPFALWPGNLPHGAGRKERATATLRRPIARVQEPMLTACDGREPEPDPALGRAYLDDWSDPFKAQCELDRALGVVEARIQRGRA